MNYQLALESRNLSAQDLLIFGGYRERRMENSRVLCPDYIPEENGNGKCRCDGSHVTEVYCRDVVGLNYGHCPLETN